MDIFRKKKKVGMQARPREKTQVEADYQAEALHAGHKSRLIIEHTEMIDRLKREVEEHLSNMQKLDLEFQVARAKAEREAQTPEATA